MHVLDMSCLTTDLQLRLQTKWQAAYKFTLAIMRLTSCKDLPYGLKKKLQLRPFYFVSLYKPQHNIPKAMFFITVHLCKIYLYKYI